MSQQIDQLNQAVIDLQAANTALAARVNALQAPDMSGAISGIQGVTASLNALAQPASAAPVATAPAPTAV